MKKGKKDMKKVVKQIEKALYALKYYPVAVEKDAKAEAIDKLISIYMKGDDTIRQLLLYMIHENLAESMNLKVMHTHEYFKMKKPDAEPSRLRMNVYRAMFNYMTSLEGLTELISLLGKLKGSDDAAKLLTYHFSHLSTIENEATHILRGAILEALGESESGYALEALLRYARYTDNDRTFQRVVSALMEWEDKLEGMKLKKEEEEDLRAKLKDVTSRDFSRSHYG